VDGVEVSPKVRDSVFGSSPTAGITVDENTVLQLAAFWGCVRYISSQVGMMPAGVYQAVNGHREERRGHPKWDTLHTAPSLWTTAKTMKSALLWNALVSGNAYADVRNMRLLDSSRMSVYRVPSGVLYEYRDEYTNEPRPMLPSEVFHLRGPSRDGIVGLSVVSAAREGLSLGLAAQSYGSAFFGNNTQIGGVFQTDVKLTDDHYERLRQEIADKRGSKRAHKGMVLDGGLKYIADSIPPEDAQFLQTRVQSARDVCALFGVPPHKIGVESGATAYSSREQAALEAVIDCLQPWVTEFEQEANLKLLSGYERRQGFYIHLNMDSLLRGDAKSRAEAFQIRLRNASMSPNEWAAAEDAPPVPGGDERMISRDLIPLSQVGEYAASQIEKNAPTSALEPVLVNAKERIADRWRENDQRGKPRDTAFADKVLAPIEAAFAKMREPFDREAVLTEIGASL
jgi:HK97 family phage portal protein